MNRVELPSIPTGLTRAWDVALRALLGGARGSWGDADGLLTDVDDFKCTRAGRIVWVSFSGTGNKTVSLPWSVEGAVSNCDGGTAVISGSTITITAAGAYTVSMVARVV